MTLPVSLRNVAGEMGLQNDEARAYINRRTGEIIMITEEEAQLVEDEEDLDNVPQWVQDVLPQVREVLQSDDYLPLPSKWEIHEYEIMARFCSEVEGKGEREELQDAIHGRGAFRRFRDTVERLGLLDAWYAYKEEALAEIAAEWLQEQEIPFVHDVDTRR